MDKISGINNSGINNIDNKKPKIHKTDEFKKLMKEKKGETENSSNENTIKNKEGLNKIELPEEAKKAIENTPDVRAEKVAQLKKLIAEGKYKIDSKTLAEAMLKKGFRP